MTKEPVFDPYAVLAALDRERVSYVVIGAFARVVHGSAETTDGLDVVPSLREENLRRLDRALDDLEANQQALEKRLAVSKPLTVQTRAGELRLVSEPWGTRGYDDLRRRAVHEHLGRGVRTPVASIVDCVRMLDASDRSADAERLRRLRRLMELERQLIPQRGIGLER